MSTQKIQLITATELPTVREDRLGGELQNLPQTIIKKALGTEIDIAIVEQNLNKCLQNASQIFANLRQKVLDGWEIDTVALSLAVSAEGSIGIATAGVEGSIEVTFKPKS